MNQNSGSLSTPDNSMSAEDILLKAELTPSMLLARITDCFYALDRDFRFTYVNPQTEAYFGLSKEQLLGKMFIVALPKARDHECWYKHQQAMREQQPQQIEFLSPTAGKWVDMNIYPTTDGLTVLFRDVTERVLAERDLRDNRRRLREAQHLAGMGNWEWNLSTGQVFWSPEIYVMHGQQPDAPTFTPDELLNHVHPDDKEKVSTSISKAIAEGKSADLEYRTVRPDGSVRVIHAIGAVTEFDALGNPLIMVGTNQDVTDRKLAEESLRASQSLLVAALASMTDSVFITDTQGRFIEYNEAFATFHKFNNKAECLKTLQEHPAILEVRHPNGEIVPIDQWAVPRALRGETAVNVIFHLRRKDTSESWFGSYNFSPIRNQDGEIVGSIVVGRDITADIQAQQALQESQMRLTMLFQHAQDAILLADDEAKYVDVNPAACQLTGYTREELLLRKAWDITPALEIERGLELWRKFILDGQQSGEYLIMRRDGEMRTVDFRAVANILPGLHLSIMHDVTERKEAEAALQLVHDELAHAYVLLQAKESERNRLMQRLITAQEEERQRLSRELHDQTAQHLAALRMMLGTLGEPLQSHPEHFDLLTQVQDLTEQLGKELHTLAWELRPSHWLQAGIATALSQYVKEWSVRSGIAASFHFRGDEHRRFLPLHEITVFRVIQEALTNVLKYAEARQVTVALELFPDRIRAIVEDDGVGFSPEESMKTAKGLGLRGMRERLALVGGALEIESTSGYGTAIYIDVPLSNE